ncbi:MAG: DUF1648 domain-containing protein [Firmicutes bacterium]|nr:DUF1648 domain-containing protein [Bacillota bacterium]
MRKEIIYLIMNIIGVLALLGSTLFVIIMWSQIPDQIPTHYNFAGEADGYGGKGSLIFMMVLAWFVFILITVLMRFPNTWNMPVKVTAENKARLYSITKAMLEVIKMLVSLLFAVMLINAAIATPMPRFILIALIAAMLLSIIMGIFMMYKNR